MFDRDRCPRVTTAGIRQAVERVDGMTMGRQVSMKIESVVGAPKRKKVTDRKCLTAEKVETKSCTLVDSAPASVLAEIDHDFRPCYITEKTDCNRTVREFHRAGLEPLSVFVLIGDLGNGSRGGG